MTPIFGRLEVIDDPWPRAAAFNMAADEALLAGLADAPLLRLYRWERPAVSFGYFDRAAPLAARFPGRDLVRRWTGGGVVEHGRDFTYSLVVPRAHALTAGRAEESYRVVHAAVARALAAAGAGQPAVHSGPPGAAAAGRSQACFVHPVRFDLLLAGEKVAGAAQRRTRRGWLHQGSVLLTQNAAAGYAGLRETLPAALGAEIRTRAMSLAEEAAGHALVRSRYGRVEWRDRT